MSRRARTVVLDKFRRRARDQALARFRALARNDPSASYWREASFGALVRILVCLLAVLSDALVWQDGPDWLARFHRALDRLEFAALLAADLLDRFARLQPRLYAHSAHPPVELEDPLALSDALADRLATALYGGDSFRRFPRTARGILAAMRGDVNQILSDLAAGKFRGLHRARDRLVDVACRAEAVRRAVERGTRKNRSGAAKLVASVQRLLQAAAKRQPEPGPGPREQRPAS